MRKYVPRKLAALDILLEGLKYWQIGSQISMWLKNRKTTCHRIASTIYRQGKNCIHDCCVSPANGWRGVSLTPATIPKGYFFHFSIIIPPRCETWDMP